MADDADFTYTDNGVNATITGYTGTDSALVIPSTLGGYPVILIASEAFRSNAILTSVTLLNGVITIGPSAFRDCSNLTSMTIPNSVQTIGSSAFRACISLTELTIPASVTSIGRTAFQGCSLLVSMLFNGNAPTAGEFIFRNSFPTVYRMADAEEWDEVFADRPVEIWNNPPTTPTLLSPANEATAVSLTPTLEASAFVAPNNGDTHASSQWQVASSSDFLSSVWDSGVYLASTSATVPVGLLGYSTTYYWHVRYKDSGNKWSDWSESYAFTSVPSPTYTVTYNANDATSGTEPVSHIKRYGVDVALFPNYGGLARIGYTFDGWNTAANGTGIGYDEGGIYSADEAVTFYAKWTGNLYTVTYDAQSRFALDPVPINVIYGSAYGTLATPTRTGYTFLGWWTAAGGAGTEITDETVVATAGAHTLYAKWIADSDMVDVDGDGYSDITVFDTATGNWYIQYSSENNELQAEQFGWWDVVPVPADYDGDGFTDIAVYHPAEGMWYIQESSAPEQMRQVQWGWSEAAPVPGDYDGDGMADIAVFHQATGNWYIQYSTRDNDPEAEQFGWWEVVPVPADYDGDGITDIAVYYPDGGIWYIRESSAPELMRQVQWGWSEAVPVPSDYDGDGKTDLAVFHRETGNWYIQYSMQDNDPLAEQFGWSEVFPVPADYDGDGKTDIAVYYAPTGTWYIRESTTGEMRQVQWGWSDAIPTLLITTIHDWFGMP